MIRQQSAEKFGGQFAVIPAEQVVRPVVANDRVGESSPVTFEASHRRGDVMIRVRHHVVRDVDRFEVRRRAFHRIDLAASVRDHVVVTGGARREQAMAHGFAQSFRSQDGADNKQTRHAGTDVVAIELIAGETDLRGVVSRANGDAAGRNAEELRFASRLDLEQDQHRFGFRQEIVRVRDEGGSVGGGFAARRHVGAAVPGEVLPEFLAYREEDLLERYARALGDAFEFLDVLGVNLLAGGEIRIALIEHRFPRRAFGQVIAQTREHGLDAFPALLADLPTDFAMRSARFDEGERVVGHDSFIGL